MAIDMYLTVGGNTIKGESQATGHKGDADVLSFAWGASNSGSTHTAGGNSAGKAYVQDFTLTKYIDSMTTGLLTALFTGTHFPSMVVKIYKAGANSQIPYLSYEFTKVLVTSHVTDGSGGEDRFVETMTVNFAKVKVTTYGQDSKGSVSQSGTVTFDVAQNTTS